MNLIKSKEVLIIMATGIEALHYGFDLYAQIGAFL